MYIVSVRLDGKHARKSMIDLLSETGFKIFTYNRALHQLTLFGEAEIRNMVFLGTEIHAIYNGEEMIGQDIMKTIEKEGVAYSIEKRL